MDSDVRPQLYRSINDGCLEPPGRVTKEVLTAGSPQERVSILLWIVNDIDASAANDPRNIMLFAALVQNRITHPTVWAHGADARTFFPQQDMPTSSCK